MRAAIFVFTAAALAVACHHTPEETTAPADAAAAADVAILEAAAPVGASSSDEPAVDVDAGRAALRDFCNDVYSADLDRLKDKCAPADLKTMEAMSRAAARLCLHDLVVAIGRHRADVDEDAAKRCVEMLRKSPLTQSSEVDTLFQHFPCDRVLLGMQPEGQACRFSIECKDGLACVGYNIGGDGTCKKPPKAKEACTLQPYGTMLNEAAAALHHPACAAGAYCDGATCQLRAAAGKGCNGAASCQAGLSCVTGKCGARAPAGGTCAQGSDCAFGLWCDRAGDAGPGKCAARHAEGAACTSPDECRGRCDIPKSTDGHPAGPGKCLPVCGSG
ncbi:MAG TPA: hypothetical protein VIF15_05760 [Polyangiaceae bacterium]|jgi:hypothetical protein